ncbi:MAG TPA: hypothetical protein VFQ92_04165 [Blastocatellia bacterium]|nr:hypothetical protein [Blastocatellia bacterium]
MRVLIAVAMASLMVLTGAPFSSEAQVNMQIELAVDTADIEQDGVLALFGGLRLQGDKGLPVGAGDINADGRADVIFCGMYGDAGGGFRRNNGQVNFYISDGRDSGFVDQAQNPPNILTMAGADSGDLLGTSVSTGDINGDGIRDVILGAAGDDGPGNSRFNSGATYIVLGSRDFDPPADLQTITGDPPPGVIVLYGSQAGGRNGIWVDAGDINGDGFDDIVMGADQLSTAGKFHRGGSCIIFGGPDLPQVIDLAAVPQGVQMAVILGSFEEEHWGAALHVGDINNDGIKDVAVGGSIYRDSASYVTPQDQESGHDDFGASFNGQRNRCGEVFVIYGQQNWPTVTDLSNPPASATRVIGARGRDLLGSQIHSADLNGDGRTELIMGALQALAPDSRGRTGAVYVIYGSTGVQGATVDLANPGASGLRVSTIYGEENLDCGGDSVRAFDINRDGKAELFIGSPEHSFLINGEMRNDAGDTKFIFGRSEFLPEVIKLYSPPAGLRIFRLAGANGALQGIAGGDEFSYRLTGGDVDGDGFIDYISNAMHGDGFMNGLNNAGEVYIFSGRKLSAKLGMLQGDPDPVFGIQTAALTLGGQTVSQASAGQSGLQIIINGMGFRADTEVLINGAVVVSRIPDDPQLAATRRTVSLDENLAIRNTPGQLRVRVRNTNPPSAESNEIVAGTLLGPAIDTIKVKRKPNGLLILVIRGSGFQAGMTVTVLRENGEQVPLNSISFISAGQLKVKISAGAAPVRGSVIRVRAATASGVQTNELVVTVSK